MLALRSYGQSNGFSVMDADELFFINGGSGNTESPGNSCQNQDGGCGCGDNCKCGDDINVKVDSDGGKVKVIITTGDDNKVTDKSSDSGGGFLSKVVSFFTSLFKK